MLVEVTELVWEDVSVGDKVKLVLSIALLHFHYVLTQLVFPSYFVTGREVVYLLVLIQTFIQVGFARRIGPENIPLMGLSVLEGVGFQN